MYDFEDLNKIEREIKRQQEEAIVEEYILEEYRERKAQNKIIDEYF